MLSKDDATRDAHSRLNDANRIHALLISANDFLKNARARMITEIMPALEQRESDELRNEVRTLAHALVMRTRHLR